MTIRELSIMSIVPLLTLTFSYSASAADVTINWNDMRQEIVGFGAGCENEDGRKIMALPEPVRTQFYNALFDSVTGIGLNIVRTHQPPDLLDAAGNWNWNSDSPPIAGKAMDQVTIMQEAQKRGVTKFWAAPWAAVPMWKQNPVINGGEAYGGGGPILRSHYQDYANYQSRFIREYKTRFGIPFMGISVQNEPQFDPGYGGCPWSGADIRDYIRDYLGPTLARDSVKISIIAAESNWNQVEYIDPTMNDPNAFKYLDIVAFHQYEGAPFRYNKAFDAGKQVWQSEVSFSGTDAGPGMACHYANQIWDNLTNAEVSSWNYWWFLGNGGILLYQNSQLVLTKLFYYIGHYSKFVRPGFRRITCTPSSIKGPGNGPIGITAFRNPSTGRFAIVVINWDGGKPQPAITYHFNGISPAKVTPYLSSGENVNQNIEKMADITVVNGAFSYAVPNISIATFVGDGTPSPVENKSALQPARMLSTAVAISGGIRLHMPNPVGETAALVDLSGRTVVRWTVKALTEQTLAVSSSLPRQLYHFRLTGAGKTVSMNVIYR